MYALTGAGAELDDEALLAAYAVPDGDDPHVRMNFVTSADGAVSLDGLSGGLSGPADKKVFGVVRDLADVVLVGAGTVRDEGYAPPPYSPARRARRLALGRAELPTFAVVSGTASIEPDHPLLVEAEPGNRTIVITSMAAPARRRAALADTADVIVAGDEALDLPAAVDALAARGLRRILCEGGARLFGALLADDLVDELCLTVSPVLAGAGSGRIVAGPPTPPRPLRLVHALGAEGMLLLRYACRRSGTVERAGDLGPVRP